MVNLSVRSVAGATAALALCFSSTAASAASIPDAPVSIRPFVALSAYGTIQSRSAVCAAAVGAAGASAAAAAQGQVAAPGCVLPQVDPVVATPVPAPVAVVPPPVAYAAPVAGGGLGLGVGAILAGLIAVAGLAAVILSGNGKGRLPITPD